MDDNDESQMDIDRSSGRNGEKMFTLKKWNAVAMWSWDVECDTCAICRVQVMGMHITFAFALLYTGCCITTIEACCQLLLVIWVTNHLSDRP